MFDLAAQEDHAKAKNNPLALSFPGQMTTYLRKAAQLILHGASGAPQERLAGMQSLIMMLMDEEDIEPSELADLARQALLRYLPGMEFAEERKVIHVATDRMVKHMMLKEGNPLNN